MPSLPEFMSFRVPPIAAACIILSLIPVSCGPLRPEEAASGNAGKPPTKEEDSGPMNGDTSGLTAQARQFLADYGTDIRPLEVSLARAWWNANTSGQEEDFRAKEEAQNRLDAALSDSELFGSLKRIHESMASASGMDPELVRQIELAYLILAEKQVDPELLRRMSARANSVEKAFNLYRARVGDEEMTDSEVRRVLKQSTDVENRKAVWEASKGVGSVVETDLRELVRLRNEAARKLGFRDYHAMQLELNEQTQEEVLELFDELEALTRGPFREVKAKIDAQLADDYGIPLSALRPWHYQDPFFQEAPAIYELSLDNAYSDQDIPDLCRMFYAGIGLPVDEVLKRSDLFEREGKSPHAFCTDIDRDGDVRVLANIVPNEYWMGTLLHELGHAVYSSRNIPSTVPYLLRAEAHILTTEGIAMLFEKFSKNAGMLRDLGVDVADPEAFTETGRKMRRDRLLIFAAWCQVMLRFEVAMYADPDQDLNKLWWDLVEKYQEIRRPDGRDAPDYAAKIHVVSAPAYYHNYLMGELFASQLHHTLATSVLHTEPDRALYNGREEVGNFLKEKVFAPGRKLDWRQLTRQATGADLNARAFAEELRRD